MGVEADPVYAPSLPRLVVYPPPTPAQTEALIGPIRHLDLFHRPLNHLVVGHYSRGKQGPLSVMVAQLTFLQNMVAMVLSAREDKTPYTMLAATNTRWFLPSMHVVPRTLTSRWQRWRGRTIVPLHDGWARDWEVFGEEPERIRRLIPPSTLEAIEALGPGAYFEADVSHLVIAVPGETPTTQLASFAQQTWPLVVSVVQRLSPSA